MTGKNVILAVAAAVASASTSAVGVEPTPAASSPLIVELAGVGRVTEKTAFTRDAIAAALAGLEVRKASRRSEGMAVPMFRARRSGKTILEIFEGSAGRVGRVVVTDPSVATRTGAKVGMSFSNAYGDDAPRGCAPGQEESSGKVLCDAPELPRVRLVFGGRWDGPDGELPPPAVLADWTVAAIVWTAR